MKRTLSRPLVLAISALGIVAVALGGCTQTVSAPPANTPHTVTASGSGTVHAAPDEATMSFGVSKSSGDAKTLLADTAAAADKIVAALRKAGVADKDIQTQNVSLFPQTNFVGGKTVVTGYQASIDVSVRVRDLTRLGDIITAGNTAAANTVSGPSFDIAADSPLNAQAIVKAVADARSRAESMAKAAGASVGRVISISDSTPAPIQPFGFASAAKPSTAPGVTINPGQVDVTSNIVVVFELK